MEDYKREMGKRLSAYRKELHLTQEKVSEMLDISLKHYSELERGITGIYLLIGDESNVTLSPMIQEKYNSFTPAQQRKIMEIMNIICTFDDK